MTDRTRPNRRATLASAALIIALGMLWAAPSGALQAYRSAAPSSGTGRPQGGIPSGRHVGTDENGPPADTADHTTGIAVVGVLGGLVLVLVVSGTVVIARRQNSRDRE